MEQEIWKDVVGWEGLYKVSNLGRVKSLPKLKKTPTTTFWTEERFIDGYEDKGGYLRVQLCRNGKSYHIALHRLVAEAFIGERKGLTINHKDENKKNNHADNLEYLTRADNIRYGSGVRRSAENRRYNPLIGKAVNQYSLDGRFIRRYKSASLAAFLNGWGECSSDIHQCCRRERHTANGYIWRHDGDTDPSFERKTNARGVTQFDLDMNFVAEYDSLEEASQVTHTPKSLICRCCRGERTHTKGFIWKYKE